MTEYKAIRKLVKLVIYKAKEMFGRKKRDEIKVIRNQFNKLQTKTKQTDDVWECRIVSRLSLSNGLTRRCSRYIGYNRRGSHESGKEHKSGQIRRWGWNCTKND